MCCEVQGGAPSDGNKDVCKDCGSTTYGGYSEDICGYSPVLCKSCGDAPCDLSC